MPSLENNNNDVLPNVLNQKQDQNSKPNNYVISENVQEIGGRLSHVLLEQQSKNKFEKAQEELATLKSSIDELEKKGELARFVRGEWASLLVSNENELNNGQIEYGSYLTMLGIESDNDFMEIFSDSEETTQYLARYSEGEVRDGMHDLLNQAYNSRLKIINLQEKCRVTKNIVTQKKQNFLTF